MKVFLVFSIWWIYDSMIAATKCPDLKWGENCESRCGPHCKHFCDDDTGICLSCALGYWGDNCNFICPSDCQIHCDYVGLNNFLYSINIEYVPGFCGPYCNKHSGTCFECKDDHYWGEYCNISCRTIDHNCDRCHITGEVCSVCSQDVSSSSCMPNCYPKCARCGANGDCYDCLPGFWGSECSKTCPENCRVCWENTGNCAHCIDGHWGENCTETCSWSNCSHCNQRNGMCETCETGFWGPNCESKCFAGCADTRCERHTGACEVCKHSYWGVSCNLTCTIDNCESLIGCSKMTGPSCHKCINEKWGDQCSKDCPNDCVNGCETRSGECQDITTSSFLDSQITNEANLKLILGLSIGSSLVTILIVTIAKQLFKSLFMSGKSQLNKVNKDTSNGPMMPSVVSLSDNANLKLTTDDGLSSRMKGRKRTRPQQQDINLTKVASVKSSKENKEPSGQRGGANSTSKSVHHR